MIFKGRVKKIRTFRHLTQREWDLKLGHKDAMLIFEHTS